LFEASHQHGFPYFFAVGFKQILNFLEPFDLIKFVLYKDRRGQSM